MKQIRAQWGHTFINASIGCLVHAQSRATLCSPVDCSPPGFSGHGISHARTLQRVAISSSRGSFWPRDQTCICWIGRLVLYHWVPGEAQYRLQVSFKKLNSWFKKKNDMYYGTWADCVLLGSNPEQKYKKMCLDIDCSREQYLRDITLFLGLWRRRTVKQPEQRSWWIVELPGKSQRESGL